MGEDANMHNILVPSAGGPAATCCIKALRMSSEKCRITSVDPNPLAAGFFLSDKSYVVPLAKNEKSLMEMSVKICKKETIDIIMPTSGFDTPIHAKNRRVFEKMGISLPFSDYHVIQTCQNKLSWYNQIQNKEIMPLTSKNVEDLTLPLIVKPKIGLGPKRVFKCRNEADLEYALSRIEDPIFQEPLPGKEYTVDVLSDLEGGPLIAVARERIEEKAGITYKGKIVFDEEIEGVCLDVAKELKIKGPSCIQLKRDEKKRPKLIDINPRMGGTTIITTLAGVNFPELVIKLCNHERFEIPKPKKITITRYYEEIVL